MKNSKKINFIIRILGTIIILTVIYFQIDFRQFVSNLLSSNWLYLIVAVLVIIFGMLISSLKWKVILSFYKIDISLAKLFTLYWGGSFFNQFLPTSFGGDVYKYYYLKNQGFGDKKGQITSSILLERSIGLYSSTIFALVFFIIFESNAYYNLAIGAAFLLVLMILLMFFWFTQSAKKDKIINREFKNKWISKFIKIINIFLRFNSLQIMLLAVTISFLFTFLCVLVIYFSFLAVNFPINFEVLLFIVPITNLAKMIPITINSIGVTEGFGIVLFSIYNISKEITVSAMVYARIPNLIVGLLGGMVYLYLIKTDRGQRIRSAK